MGTQWTHAKVLITARTYPAPARKGIEVSCTGGITANGKWIRLHPVPYRFLDEDKRFRKYQWIDVRITKSSDSRPESFTADLDSIVIASDPISTDHYWQARQDLVTPLQSPSLCWLQAERNRNKFPTLGFFKPKVINRLTIEPDSRQWTDAELVRLRQFPLFGTAPAQELEKLPYKFKYRFDCNEPRCRGHELSCMDWELGQSYRRWRRKYGTDWEWALRQRYEHEMIEQYDTHFFVGTVRNHPDSWIIVGLYYPPKRPLGSHPVATQRPLL